MSSVSADGMTFFQRTVLYNMRLRGISFEDFVNKIDLSDVNKRAVESLIKSGAFDLFKIYRSRLLAVFEKVIEGVASERKRNVEGQISLFSLGNEKMDLPVIH